MFTFTSDDSESSVTSICFSLFASILVKKSDGLSRSDTSRAPFIVYVSFLPFSADAFHELKSKVGMRFKAW